MSEAAAVTADAARRPGAARALLALVARDLQGRRRGALVLWARGLALLASGATAIFMLAMSRGLFENDAAPAGALAIVLALAAISAVMACALAPQALRRERESGTLDLMLLAGLPPRAITLGRTISTFLFFESLLVASLPALALFWYFRRPSVSELALLVIDHAALSFALAGLVVLVSAWSRSVGFAVTLMVVLLVGWSLLLASSAEGLAMARSPVRLLVDVLGERAMTTRGPTLPVGAEVHLASLGLHVTAGVLAALAAAHFLGRSPSGASAASRRKAKPRRTTAPGAWPLSWLLLHGSAAARPRVQLVVLLGLALSTFGIALPIGLLGSSIGWRDVLDPAALLVAGALVCGLAFVIALGTAASQVAGAKERRTWDSLLSTRLPGTRILADLVRGSVVSSAVPLLLGFALTVAAFASRPHAWLVSGALAVSLLASLLLAVVVGIVASCVARTVAGALLLGALSVVGFAFVAWMSAETLNSDALVDALALGGPALAPALIALLLLVAGVVMGLVGFRERKMGGALLGLLLVLAVVVPVAATSTAQGDLARLEPLGPAAAFAHAAELWNQSRARGWEMPVAAHALGGAAEHLFVALVLASVARARADALLGRGA